MANRITDKYIPHTCQTADSPRTQNIQLNTEQLDLYNKSNDITLPESYRLRKRKQLEEILYSTAACRSINPSIFSDNKIHLFTLDPDKLEAQEKSIETIDTSLHDQIACAVDSFIYEGQTPGPSPPSTRERIRNWITKIKPLGTVTAEGLTFRASMSGNSNLFVIKTPKTSNDNLIHEAVIGLYAMNKLRRYLPNFMYVYGFAKCSPPAVSNSVLTWCASSTPASSYLILENIHNAVRWVDFIQRPDITQEDFMAIFYQLINALNVAYKLYGYTHYDLHYENILVREFDTPVVIPYYGHKPLNFKNPVGYITTAYVPVIIDYGYSRIAIGGKGFGNVNTKVWYEADEPSPMYDVHKILGFSGEATFVRNKTVWNLLNRMFTFFGDLQTVVKNRIARKTYYEVPASHAKKTHDEFLFYIDTLGLPNVIHSVLKDLERRGYSLINTNSGMDSCTFYNSFSSPKVPANNLEYCEVVNSLNDDTKITADNKKSSINWLDRRFDAERQYLLERNAFRVPDVNIQIAPFTAISPLEREVFVREYKGKVESALAKKEYIRKLTTFIRSSICALTLQKKYAKYQNEIMNFNATAATLAAQYDLLRKTIEQNDVYLTNNPSRKRVFDAWFPDHKSLLNAL